MLIYELFFFQAEDRIREAHEGLEFRRVLFRSRLRQDPRPMGMGLMGVRSAVVLVVPAALAEFHLQGRVVDAERLVQPLVDPVEERIVAARAIADKEIGRASCRESVWQYV